MFKKLKDKLKGDEKPSYGTDQHNLQSNNPYYQHSQEQSTEKYQPPPGPPPNQASSSKPGYTAPPGPPPNRNTGSSSSAYTAPTGPPPSHQSSGYAPPPGPPPSYPQQPPPSWDPPPYHDWTVIPDTALLPPPPSMGYDSSPTANATAEEGDRALAWTKAHPLWPPQTLHPSTYTAIQNAQLALLKPPSLAGDLFPQQSAGHWRIRTYPSCRDSSILSNLPLYSALTDSPLITHHPRTLYFELKVTSIGHGASSSLSEADAGIAIGFVAPPYPTFRLPGWERASLGVHGDDGRKYVNDAWGGNDFTTAFKPGDTVGIGMTFEVPKNPPAYQGGQEGKVLDIKVFFTRNGVKEGEWDGNEELDVRSEGGNVGLRGECDLFAAIGVFGGVEFDVFFHSGQWLYRPV